ncbi:hypothetical protein DPF84_04620 [Enterobacter hormaechei]|uniref:hypothetical protein n=1 Tax=Enterobacter hormaechei TaxID=158836 RepID=UPI000DBEF4B6|nr:hypothetical protein [Enterobacter hormaechei]AWX01074.1 hypothetical protein DPF84_04620 [Enterobacter hormaechei]MCL8147045.1 hypothetical protein [Enterobacter hormaechei]MCM7929610.1 hypothetical protein [Enterobacter hormaechei]MCM7949181.1 hypothetical protein [Enterobacter hormaechei]RAM39849.1 hypothetical protein DOZ52_27040 [Enterobacter hormaechei]
MQDYIVFGHGYNGDVRQGEDNQDVFEVVTKPVMLKAGEPVPDIAPLKFYKLNVHVIECNGKRYNVAADVIPSEEDLHVAILRENPKPVTHRVN